MKELICITCPKGCHLKVDEATFAVTGNACERGAEYGSRELRAPVRMVTSTAVLTGVPGHPRVPVKTSAPIPKSLVTDAVRLLDSIEVLAPVSVGDVIIKDILGTGADFVATRSFPAE